MSGIQVATPCGPRRWAQRTRKAPSAPIARAASPDSAASMTARPVATAPSRTGASRSSEAGSPASVSIQVMLSAPRAAMAASASPRGPRPRAARCLRRSGGRSGARRCRRQPRRSDALPSTGPAGRLLDRGPDRRAHAWRVGGRPDDVAEHGAGLDRGELARVADEDQPRLAPDGLGEAGHQRERHHRGLVDDHDVVGQSVAAVVAEAAVGAGLPAEQAVERRRLELEQTCSDPRVDVEAGRLVVDRLREPCGGLAGRGGERDERGRGARGQRLLLEQRDDAGDGRGLAGARASGDDRQSPQHRGGGRLLLADVGSLAAEEPGDTVGEHVHPDAAVGTVGGDTGRTSVVGTVGADRPRELTPRGRPTERRRRVP